MVQRQEVNEKGGGELIGFIVSAVVTAALCPYVRRLMICRGVIDIPNHRSSHSLPTPRGGGLACGIGVIVGCIATAPRNAAALWFVLAAALALAGLGYIDDRRGVDPLLRLAVQAVVGVVLGMPLGGLVGMLIGAVALPAVLNPVNFMDGVNGITAITMVVWGVSASWLGSYEGNAILLVLGGVTAGAALGFLPWNLPTARLFLGDVGSYLFGGLVAGAFVFAAFADVRLSLLAAPLSVYLLDVGVTLLRRLRARAPLLKAHRDHVYQRLVSVGGLSHGFAAGFAGTCAALITLAWTLPTIWASVGFTLALMALYLASPGLVGRRLRRGGHRERQAA